MADWDISSSDDDVETFSNLLSKIRLKYVELLRIHPELNEYLSRIVTYDMFEIINRHDLTIFLENDYYMKYQFLVGLGNICLNIGKLNDAEELFTKSLRNNTANPQAWFKLGSVGLQLGRDPIQLEMYFNRSNALDEVNGDCWYYLASVKKQLGKINEAKDCYIRSMNYSFYSKKMLKEIIYFWVKHARLNILDLQKLPQQCSYEYKTNIDNINEFLPILENQIGILIMGFEDMIMYRDGANLSNVNDLDENDFIGVFGEYDRISRMRGFLNTITHHYNIKLLIWSKYHGCKIIHQCLRRLNIHITDKNYVIHFHDLRDVKQRIMDMKHEYNLIHTKQIYYLYCEEIYSIYSLIPEVDIEQNNIYLNINIIQICFNNEIKNGPSLDNLTTIEEFVSNNNQEILKKLTGRHTAASQFNSSHVLNHWSAIIHEIKMYPNRSIHSLHSLGRAIHESSSFATATHLYKQICIEHKAENFWITYNLIYELLDLIPNPGYYIFTVLARCLSFLNHIDVADKYYNIALELNCTSFYLNHSWLFHLIKTQRYHDALMIADKCLDISKYPNKNRSIYSAKAIIFDQMNIIERSCYYHKKASSFIKSEDCYPAGNYNYAQFLFDKGMYEEASEQVDICLRSNAKNFKYIKLKLRILLKLNHTPKMLYYLNAILLIDAHSLWVKEKHCEIMRKLFDHFFWDVADYSGNADDDDNNKLYDAIIDQNECGIIIDDDDENKFLILRDMQLRYDIDPETITNFMSLLRNYQRDYQRYELNYLVDEDL